MILSILICSIEERSEKLKTLLGLFDLELKKGYDKKVEILVEVDNKEMSIGNKRQKLLERATGDFIVFFDDDDLPSHKYIELIFHGIFMGPNIDCIGIRGIMTTNGTNTKTWCHRLGFKIEGNGVHPHHSGYDYVRPIIHFNPVKRSLALQAGFKDMRFGEDMDYASRLNPLLKKEYFIDEILFHYRYNSNIDHKKKYGII